MVSKYTSYTCSLLRTPSAKRLYSSFKIGEMWRDEACFLGTAAAWWCLLRTQVEFVCSLARFLAHSPAHLYNKKTFNHPEIGSSIR